jgi:hypothetical protein
MIKQKNYPGERMFKGEDFRLKHFRGRAQFNKTKDSRVEDIWAGAVVFSEIPDRLLTSLSARGQKVRCEFRPVYF